MQADLLILNANVYMVDSANPQAKAVGVRSNGETRDWRGDKTQVIGN